jgi:hypothetical protein
VFTSIFAIAFFTSVNSLETGTVRIRLGNADILSVADHIDKPLVVAIAALDSVAAKQDERKSFTPRVAITAFLSGSELSTIVTKILNSGSIALCA